MSYRYCTTWMVVRYRSLPPRRKRERAAALFTPGGYLSVSRCGAHRQSAEESSMADNVGSGRPELKVGSQHRAGVGMTPWRCGASAPARQRASLLPPSPKRMRPCAGGRNIRLLHREHGEKAGVRHAGWGARRARVVPYAPSPPGPLAAALPRDALLSTRRSDGAFGVCDHGPRGAARTHGACRRSRSADEA